MHSLPVGQGMLVFCLRAVGLRLLPFAVEAMVWRVYTNKKGMPLIGMPFLSERDVRSLFLLYLGVAAHELVYTTCCVYQFGLSCVERV